jgi:hypothetical protein
MQALLEDEAVHSVHLSPWFVSTLVSVLGSEVVGEFAAGSGSTTLPRDAAFSANSSYADRVMGEHGQGTARLSSPHVLYTPVPGLAVIGEQLYEKQDECLGCSVQTLLRFTPLRLQRTLLRTYRPSSYGQLSRDVVYSMLQSGARRGRDLVDYLDVLLHRNHHTVGQGLSSASPPAAEGVVRMFGSIHEPLHVLYTSRAALRFSCDLSFPICTGVENGGGGGGGDVPGPSVTDPATASQHEQALLEELWGTLRAALWAAAGGEGSSIPARHAFFIAGSCFMDEGIVELAVYPRSDSPLGSTTAESSRSEDTSADERRSPLNESSNNSERRFEMKGNVFGRLACRKVMIRLAGASGVTTPPLPAASVRCGRFVVSVEDLRRDVVSHAAAEEAAKVSETRPSDKT